MKTAEPRPAATVAKTTPFFSKDSSQDFFGSSVKEKPFFAKNNKGNSAIQTKLTIGQPNDKYEQEADTMADKVVQRLSENRIQAKTEKNNHFSPNKNEGVIQQKSVAPISSITPFVQTKCASCEEEKLQKKEKEDDTDLSKGKLQKKPIFESNAEPPDDEKNIQRKCEACEQEEKIQRQPDFFPTFSSSPNNVIHLKNKKSSPGQGSCGGPWTCASGNDCTVADNSIIGPMPLSTWWKLIIMIDTEALSPGDVNESNFGHTYVEFSESNGNIYTYGFYPNPATQPSIIKTQVFGCVVHPDKTHKSCVDYQEMFSLTELEYKTALSTAQDFCKAPPRYDLPNWNCTTFADFIGKKAGKTLPSIRGKVGNVVTADNPNTLLEGLKERDKNKSADGGVSDEKKIRRKCVECENEEKLQKKEELDKKDFPKDKLQKKPIFESNAEPSDDKKNVQLKSAECEKEDKPQKKPDPSSSQTTSPNIESSLNSSKGSGNPLPPATLIQMESSFGTDFSSVRIHNDSSAVQMNKDLHAQAFTHGSDIYFNSGTYDTNSNSGKQLLAHELTHTIQQSSAGFSNAKVTQALPNIIQGSWIGDRIEWVRTATRDNNWAGSDPPGAYYVLNGLSMDDMVRLLRALTPADRKKLSDNLNEQAGGFDRSRIQLGLTNAAAPTSDTAFRKQSENLHWAIRSGNYSNPPDGAFFLLTKAKNTEQDRLLAALNRDALDALMDHRDEANAVPGGTSIVSIIEGKRAGSGVTIREKKLHDLLEKSAWTEFFTEFNGMNQTDELRFVRGANKIDISRIRDNISAASGIADQNRIFNLLPPISNSSSDLPFGMYVDRFVDVIYDIDYRSQGGNSSKFLTVRYSDEIAIDLNIDTIKNDGNPVETFDIMKNVHLGDGGRIFPQQMNQFTTPRLNAAKRDAIAIMEQYFLKFLEASVTAVIFIITMPMTVGGKITGLVRKPLSRRPLGLLATSGKLLIDEGRTLTTEELIVARQLIKEGKTVRVLAESTATGVRTADFLVDGVKTELKTISNLTSKDISGALGRRILDGAGQASHLIADVRNQPGLTKELAERAIRRAFGADTLKRLQQIRVIGKGFDVVVNRL